MKLYLVLLLLAANTYVAVCDFDDYDDDAMVDMGDDADDEIVEETVAPKPKREQKYYVPPVAQGRTFFAEPFESENVLDTTWVRSKAKKDGVDADIAKYDGKWSIEEPDEQPLRGDLGLVLKSKAKHHAISAMLDKPYTFLGKPFVMQYEVKFQNALDCGGAYVKLLSEDDKLKLTEITDKTPYTIMFGPDKCGNDAKLHFIFRHKNPKTGVFEEKHAKRPTVSIEKYFSDKKTHLYTLVVASDNSFEIFIDNTVVNTGNLLEDFTPEVNPPEEIDDPNDKKPDDWDEKEKIRDPNAVKPDDWDENQPAKIPDESATKPEGWLDDEPELIPDPEAVMPDDWDDEMDGEWEAPSIPNPKCDVGCGEWKPPMIDNPKYKGKWSAPLIENPNYKGKWKPQRIKNPNYFYDDHPYKMTPISAIALELWSMSEGILFDNFIITDNKAIADQWATDSFFIKKGEEDFASGGESVIQRLIATTNERPWLWAVYIIVIVLPVTLIIIYCCSSSPAKDAGTKKTDETSPDDVVEEEEEEGGNDEAEEEIGNADDRGGGDAAEPEKKSARKADLETEPTEEAEVDEGKKSPRRRKPRKE